MIAAILVLLAPEAYATSINTRFCALITVDYDDTDPTLGDDYWTSSSTFTVKATGVHIKVTQEGTGTTMFNAYAYTSGTNEGCTPLLGLDNAYDYTMTVYSSAGMAGPTTVDVFDDDATPALDSYSVTGITPLLVLPTRTYTVPLSNRFRILAAEAFALSREHGYATNEHYISYAQACNTGSGFNGVCCHSSGAVYQGTGHRKYIIGHELGHCLFKAHNGGLGCDIDYGPDADADNCDDVMEETFSSGEYCASQQACGFGSSALTDGTAGGHQMNSREYQSSAVYEGFAHFYAAHTWNDANSDCKFYYYKSKLNWNANSVIEAGESSWNLHLDCEGGLTAYGVDGAAYLEDYCGTSSLNRGVEYDWLRMFWDLRTDEGVAFDDIVEILADANCNSWNDTELLPVEDRPWERLNESAYDNLLSKEWTFAATTNGVDH